MYGILLSRFTNETLQENRRWKDLNNTKCVYGSSVPISENLPLIEYFVIEMNINENRIEGIGIIQNKRIRNIRVYSNPYFNRYIYLGKHFISIENMNSTNKEIIKELEKLIFYGKTHLKRGGLTLFPPKLIKNNKINYIIWLKELLKEYLIHENLIEDCLLHDERE
jgi:hypothetical protein